MVELSHTAIADPAMLGPKRSDDSTGVAQAKDVRAPGAFPLVVASDLLDGATERSSPKLCQEQLLQYSKPLVVGSNPTRCWAVLNYESHSSTYTDVFICK
jgi:hypothetical protein